MDAASFTGTSQRLTFGWMNDARHTWVISIERCPSMNRLQTMEALRPPKVTPHPNYQVVLRTLGLTYFRSVESSMSC
jgi:hypothetical protein